MIQNVKIIGAGSIGNHLAHASRQLGWSVDICDIDEAALQRTEKEIYPARYGAWDDGIRLFRAGEAPVNDYDLIVIGTPPDSHVELALSAAEEEPKAILIEKPLGTPGLEQLDNLVEVVNQRNIFAFTGYDHAVGQSALAVSDMLQANAVGKVLTLDVEFREHWGGIFGAHPWLDGPADSYLGFWSRGGGACGEHSHAINLWQLFSSWADLGRVVAVNANMSFVNEGGVDYDSLCLLTLTTESGICGRVVQDVVTRPTRKWGAIQGAEGRIEWICGLQQGVDAVTVYDGGGKESDQRLFPKTRPDDFIAELTYLDNCVRAGNRNSWLSLERGLESMLVIAAAHLSARERRTVTIDYDMGFCPSALK